MDGQSTGKFTWVIENFSELKHEQKSPEFTVGCCKWRLVVDPKGEAPDHLAVYLEVANPESLGSQWRRFTVYTLIVVNQLFVRRSLRRKTESCFNPAESGYGFPKYIPLNELEDPTRGFLVNNRIIVEAELEVVEVEDDLDILETLTPEEDRANDAEEFRIFEEFASAENLQESLEYYEVIETDETRSDGAAHTAKTELMIQTVDVDGFVVHDTQAKQVMAIFEKHPDLSSDVQIKNQQLRTAFMNALLDLIETLRRSPQDITEEDFSKGRNTLIDLEEIGLNLDWLKKKFDEVWKKKQRAGGSRIEELEKQSEMLKTMMSNVEAALKKEKEEVAAMRTPLSFNDFIS